jgi:hypothetical protein
MTKMNRNSWLILIIASFLFAGVGFGFGWFACSIVVEGRIGHAYVKGLEDADKANTFFNEHFQPAQSSGSVKAYVPKEPQRD